MKKLKTISFFALITMQITLNSFNFKVSATDINELTQKQESIKTEVRKAEHLLQETQAEKSNVQIEIVKLDAELDTVTEELDTITRSLHNTTQKLEEAEKNLQEATIAKEDQTDALAERIRFIYENGNIGYIDVLLSSKNFTDLVNRMEYVNQIIEYDSSLIDNLSETEKIISDQINEIEITKKEQLVQEEIQERKRLELEVAREERNEKFAILTETEIAREQEIIELEKADKEIEQLIKDAYEKAAIEKAAAEKAAIEKAATEKAAIEKAAAEKAAIEKAATEKAAIEKAATEKAAIEKASGEKAVTEKTTTRNQPIIESPSVIKNGSDYNSIKQVDNQVSNKQNENNSDIVKQEDDNQQIIENDMIVLERQNTIVQQVDDNHTVVQTTLYPEAVSQPPDDIEVIETPSITYDTLAWPVPGQSRVSSEYGPRVLRGKSEFHRGIDIPAPTGTNIVAAEAGTVISSKYINGYGYTVIIDHGEGVSTLYGHNSKLLVSEGQMVSRDEVIAKAGSTGNSTGPHCHFEVRVDGTAKNPRDYL